MVNRNFNIYDRHMQNTKLQELTEKLYQDGVSKGQQEAEALLSKAQADAAKIVSNAEQEAAAIKAKAEKTAAETMANAESEIRMAYRQTSNAIKQSIEKLVVAHAITAPNKEAVQDVSFIQSILKEAILAFNPKNEAPVSLSVLLPESAQKSMNDFLEQSIGKALANQVELHFDAALKSGFKIGPKDGGYHLSFTEQDFENLLKAYARPKLNELLFGGK